MIFSKFILFIDFYFYNFYLIIGVLFLLNCKIT